MGGGEFGRVQLRLALALQLVRELALEALFPLLGARALLGLAQSLAPLFFVACELAVCRGAHVHVQLFAARALEILRGVDEAPVALFALALALCAELCPLALEVLRALLALFPQAEALALAFFSQASSFAFALEGVVRALVGRAQRRLAVDGLELSAHRGDGVGGGGFLRRRFDVLEVRALRLQRRGLDAETRRTAG